MPELPKRFERNYLPLLLGLMAALGVLVWVDRTSQDENSDFTPRRPLPRAALDNRASSAPSTGDKAERGINPLAAIKRIQLRDTVARLLFEPSRRPFVIPKKPEIVSPRTRPKKRKRPPNPNAFALLGIVTGANTNTALLKQRRSGRSLRMQQGEIIEGWQIVRIEAQRVVLLKEGLEVTLRLFRKPSRRRN